MLVVGRKEGREEGKKEGRKEGKKEGRKTELGRQFKTFPLKNMRERKLKL